MADLLVVSRNTALSMALQRAGHDVVDSRSAATGVAPRDTARVDAVVLHTDDPPGAAALVRHLREQDDHTPIVVISETYDDWGELLHDSTVCLLGLPLSPPALLTAIERLRPLPEAAPPEEPTDGHLDAADVEVAARIAPQLAGALSPAPHTRLSSALAAAPPGAYTRPVAPPSSYDEPLADEPARPPPARRSGDRPPPPVADGSADGGAGEQLVRQLLRAQDQLIGLQQVAAAVVAEAQVRTGAEAVALLLPDGDRWRVTTGIGLRPLEHRLELTAESWLVETIVLGRQGLVIEGTDIGRQRLAGSPLSSWQNLLAAPVLAVQGLLLCASRTTLRKADLGRLVALAAEAEEPLQVACELRELARVLAPYAEPPT